MKTTPKYYRVDRKEIGFLRFIFEAYDGIATITTVDSGLGIIVFHIPEGCEQDVKMILQELQKEIIIEEIISNKKSG